MTEPTITCPNCKTEIKLNESLAAPLIEATRKQYEQQLARKDSDIAAREKSMRQKEKLLNDRQSKLDEQIADQVEEQLKKDRARIVAEESKKAKRAAATDLEEKSNELAELQEALDKNNAKLAEARVLLDEICGRSSFIASNVWQKRYSRECAASITLSGRRQLGWPVFGNA